MEDLQEERDTLAVAQGLIEDGRDVGAQVEVHDSRGHLLASSFSAPTPDAATMARRRKTHLEASFTAIATNPLGIRIDAKVTDRARQASLSALARSLLIAAIPIVAISLLIGRTMVS